MKDILEQLDKKFSRPFTIYKAVGGKKHSKPGYVFRLNLGPSTYGKTATKVIARSKKLETLIKKALTFKETK